MKLTVFGLQISFLIDRSVVPIQPFVPIETLVRESLGLSARYYSFELSVNSPPSQIACKNGNALCTM
jgi:hypothetical protein